MVFCLIAKLSSQLEKVDKIIAICITSYENTRSPSIRALLWRAKFTHPSRNLRIHLKYFSVKGNGFTGKVQYLYWHLLNLREKITIKMTQALY